MVESQGDVARHYTLLAVYVKCRAVAHFPVYGCSVVQGSPQVVLHGAAG